MENDYRLPQAVLNRLQSDEAEILARKSDILGERGLASITITNEDLEKLFAEPRKAVSGSYGFAARLVWQYEGFIFVDGINALEVY